MAERMRDWRNAWIGLALALGLHVADEATTGFLPVYNGIVDGLRARYSWVPLPTFTFRVWLGGLVLGVLLLLALTPIVIRGSRWIRLASLLLGVIMTGNALGHLLASVYWGSPAPGVYSSPILLIAALALIITALRSGAESNALSRPVVAENDSEQT